MSRTDEATSDDGFETRDADGRDLEEAIRRTRQVGEVDADEIDRILKSGEVEEVDNTREIDTREVTRAHRRTEISS